jgi:hypothetical protein
MGQKGCNPWAFYARFRVASVVTKLLPEFANRAIQYLPDLQINGSMANCIKDSNCELGESIMPRFHLVLPACLTSGILVLACATARAQNEANALKLRLEMEKIGKAAKEVQEPSPADQAETALIQLANPDPKVRGDAVGKLRLLARRVDKIGGQREQRGEIGAAKVPGLVPHLLKAADDPDETVRLFAVYALADTLDPAAQEKLRERLKDNSAKVRLAAACLLTEFHDASGLDELKAAVKHCQTSSDEFEKYFDGEKVLASLARITGKDFGKIPMNPTLLSDSRKFAPTKEQYQKLFDTWVAWWDWTPPANIAPKKMLE